MAFGVKAMLYAEHCASTLVAVLNSWKETELFSDLKGLPFIICVA